MAPTVKNSGQIGEYDGSSGSSVTFNIANCVVDDWIILFQGIDWSYPSGSSATLPTPTGTGITWTSRTITYPDTNNRGFNVVWTGRVTSAGTRAVTVASGSRDATVNANWYHLNNEWTFHAAGTTNTQAAATSGNSPSIANCQANDRYFAAWETEYQGTTQWTLPGSFTGAQHATGGDGVQSSGYEVLSSAGASGTRTATRSTSNPWCASAIVMRPSATGPVVSAGTDVSFHRANTQFNRTATEDDGGTAITSRAWTIQAGPAGVGTTIGTAAALSWTPTVAGSYTLRYSATNANGTGFDDMTIIVVPSYIRGIEIAQTNTSTCTVPVPAGTVAGDNMVAFCINDFISASQADWESVSAFGTSTNDMAINILRRTATASEPASYGFSVGASTSATIAIVVFNQDEVDVAWDVVPSGSTITTSSATANPTAPSIDIVEQDALLIAVFGTSEMSSGHSTHTPPTGMTEIVDYVGTSTSRDLHIATLITSPGASGTKTATRDSGTSNYCAQTMALKPVQAVTVSPAGIDSSTIFGTTTIHQEIPSAGGIASEEAFGLPDVVYQIKPTGILSREAFGETRVTGGIVPTGIPSEEAFGALSVFNNGLGPSSIPSAEAFGTYNILAGAILIKIEPGNGIASAEAVGDPTFFEYGLGVAGIESGEAHGTPTVNRGPVFINPNGLPTREAMGDPTFFEYGLGVAGIPSEEMFGDDIQVATLISNFAGIASQEAVPIPQLNLTIFPIGIESDEIFGSTAGEVPAIRPRQIPIRVLNKYELVCVAMIPNEAGPPEFIELDDIDWTALTVTDELSRPQSLSATAQVSRLTSEVIQRVEGLEELPTELWVNRNGQRIFSGPLWVWNVEGEEITFEAQGVLSYLDVMGIIKDFTYKAIDQFVIVKDLIDYYQGLQYGNFGLDTSSITTSGITRDITYLLKEANLLSKKIYDLGGGENGFDISADPLTRKVELHYPRQGVDRSEGEDAIIFDARNVTSPGVSSSVVPGDLASEAIGIGSNTEGEGLSSVWENPELRAKIGRRTVMQSFEAADQASLESQTQGYLTARQSALMIPGPNVRVTTDSDISKYDVGDTVRFVLHSRLAAEAAFRLRKRSVTVSKEGGTETASFQFV